jgi:PmbA protein
MVLPPPGSATSGWGGGSVFTRAGVERLADAALKGAPGAADLETVIECRRRGLTRFANSQIHQNTASEDVEVRVRAVTSDGRIGVAVAHTDNPAVAAATASQALAIARRCPADPEFPGLAPSAAPDVIPFDEATAHASPADRAAAVRALLHEVGEGWESAGALATDGCELGVFTTQGQRAYTPLSSAQLTLIVTGPSSSGCAQGGGRSVVDIDVAAVARTATGKARAGVNPVPVEAGVWPVVLEPAATATLVSVLAELGFGARGWLEGRTFTAGRLGEWALDRRVTIVDDACSPQTIGLPLDWEGTPKQRVTLVDHGVLTALVHDRHTAKQAGVASTGHGLPAPNPWGPVPLNPLLVPGDGGSIADMVTGMERGLLVTRFHYTNVVHPLETKITGMTRDGTFLVQDGRITNAVRNLRFTDTVLRAFAEVEALSSETAYTSELRSGGQVPAVRLPAFVFTSTTTFG